METAMSTSSSVPVCPYKGLGSFTVKDAEAGIFVGREEETYGLRGLVAQRALVIVTGPPGVGKTSLVDAGLIASVRSEGWLTRAFRTGRDPFFALAAAISALEQPDCEPEPEELAQRAHQIKSEGLALVGAELARRCGGPILLHVDQLEEMFDPCACPPVTAREFLSSLLGPEEPATDGLSLVCTLRADFLYHLLELPEAGARLRDALFPLSSMNHEQLSRVIREPASVSGVEVEERLVQAAATDAEEESGLPLLEYALTRLWAHQHERQISLPMYQAIGGVKGALRDYVNRQYNDLLDNFPEKRIHNVLRSLVRSYAEANRAIRRRGFAGELGADWEIAKALAERRLVDLGRDFVTGEETAELAHEVLIRQWPTLARLVDEDMSFNCWRAASMERAAAGEVLPDILTAEAERWLTERPQDIPEEIRQLVERSHSGWRRVRELEDARDTAVQLAEARRLAAAAELARTQGAPPDVPIALAVESLRTAPTIEGDIAARRAIRTAPIQRGRVELDAAPNAMAFSPDGTRVAVGGRRRVGSSEKSRLVGSARVLEVATGTEICHLDHDGTVRAVIFSPDGTHVASGAEDGTVRVINARTGAQVCRLGHNGTVHTVAFSRDGSRVVSASKEGTAKMMDAATGAEIWSHNQGAQINVAAFSPDDTLVVSGSKDGTAKMLDAATGAVIWSHDHGAEINAAAFSLDSRTVAISGERNKKTRITLSILDAVKGTGLWHRAAGYRADKLAYSPYSRQLAVGTVDQGVQVLDQETGAEVSRLTHRRPLFPTSWASIQAMAFSPDGQRLATATWDTVRVWDTVAGTELCRWWHRQNVQSVAFSPDGRQVASCTDNGDLHFYDAAAGSEMSRANHPGHLYAAAFSPGGTKVATANMGHSDRRGAGVRVVDADSGAELCRLDLRAATYAVAYSPDGSRLVAGAGSDKNFRGSALVIDSATGAEIWRVDHQGEVLDVAFSPDGTRVATASADGMARVIDAVAGTEIFRHALEHGRGTGTVRTVAFSPDGTRVVIAGENRSAWVINAITGADVCRLQHDGQVKSAAFSPDGTRVVTGGGGGRACVFDATTGAEIWRAQLGTSVDAVAFSPDGNWVAGAGGANRAAVMDAATGTVVRLLHHDWSVNSVAFSPDSTQVATASSDNSARVFDAASGTELCRLDHDESVWSVAFSPDGTRVATGSWDNSSRVWVVDHDQLIRQACGRLTRNLSLGEWQRYFGDSSYRPTRPDLPVPTV
jgi:WD40 repeat protein